MVNEIWGVPYIEKQLEKASKLPKKILAAAPDDWMAKIRIQMEVCDKDEALVVTGNGIYLKCVNYNDIAKVMAFLHAHDYNSMSAKYVGQEQFNSDGEYTGPWEHGIEAYFRRLHGDK
ncbi:hypothetical protein LCGC14_1425330 [marine sediment metagenome]|uniref:Uncharacterized protein n=1 Tax=marine sediment metagenome TaxID=412755 RepID=A0A0F9MRX4_9ZZZZ